MNKRRYGLIIEHKLEHDLICESHPMTEFQARERLKNVRNDPYIIRAAIFSMSYFEGNKNLIPESEF